MRSRFPALVYVVEGRWVRLPAYPLPPDWNRAATDVAFQIAANHPSAPPYGIYVPSGLLFRGQTPKEFTPQASNKPPFEGVWDIFSWTIQDGQWQPKTPAAVGSNLLNWALGFTERFREGV